MTHRLLYTILMAAALLFGTAQIGLAAERHPGAQGRRGGLQGRGDRHPGAGGHTGVAPRPNWHERSRGHGNPPHRPFAHDRFHRRTVVGPRVFVGPDVWWGAPWSWGPAYSYPTYPDFAPPVVVPESPPVYIQQEPPYWYYCPNPEGYYPYVEECPSGWLTVVPPTTAPPEAPTP